ncbi:MAG: DUF2752 domain-containing protein [Alloprevotella sp.]|nr:MAG: DUF2752 domain-containing protein [Alloprevotella sp.]
MFRSATGYSCPGCGAQRAIHSLLHGHFAEAISYNYFLPFVAVFLLVFQGLSFFLKRVKLFVPDFRALLISLSMC